MRPGRRDGQPPRCQQRHRPGGPAMTALLDHSTTTAFVPAQRPAPAQHDDLPKLTHLQLRAEQQRTLDTPRRRYSIAARVLFLGMDLLYGRKRTLSKFRVLEIVARVPYQTW